MKNRYVVGKTDVYRHNNKPVHYRTGSSDMRLIYEILLKKGRKADYWIPKGINPKIILDIGANIGISAIYFAIRYPTAEIYAFEPMPDNYKLLEKNVREYENIKTFNVALGKEEGRFNIHNSDTDTNYGGASFHKLGVNPDSHIEVTVKNPSTI